jgi:hypothetical protein
MSDDYKTQAQADLIYAILTLDSYDRGYGSAIISANGGLGETGSIGNFQIRPFNLGEQDGWQSAGFYAIAYNNATAGQTVIAYRGTDSATGSATSGGSDVWQGYGIALGQTNSAQGDLRKCFGTACRRGRLQGAWRRSWLPHAAWRGEGLEPLTGLGQRFGSLAGVLWGDGGIA